MTSSRAVVVEFRIGWRSVSRIGLVCGALLASVWLAEPSSGQVGSTTGLESIAILVDRAPSSESPGCGSISIFDIYSGEALYRDTFDGVGLGQIDVDADARQIITSPGGAHGTSVVHKLWQRHGTGWDDWRSLQVWEPKGLHLSDRWMGLAFVPGTSWLLMPLYQTRPLVGMFDMQTLKRVEGDRGTEWLEFPRPDRFIYTPGVRPIEILTTRDGRLAHTVDRLSNLSTIDLHSFEAAAPPMTIPPFVPDSALARGDPRGEIVFADLSVDERYLVTNRWNAPEIGITDLQRRESRVVSAGEGTLMTGDVAFNHGWENNGLLAVHAVDKVIVYRFQPDGELEELARHSVVPVVFAGSTVPAAVAWSAAGDRLIAATNSGVNDFAIFDVLECGRRLELVAEIAACSSASNQGFTIWTANKRLGPPPGYEPSCPAPDSRPTATPPPVATPSPTPFATPILGDPLLENLARFTEEGVVIFEASTDGTQAGCGGMTAFETSVGEPKGRLGGIGEPGRIAQGVGLYDFLIGPVDPSRPTYRAITMVSGTEHGRFWETEEFSPTYGVPLPYAAMTRVWADNRMLLTFRDHATDDITLGFFEITRVGGELHDEPYSSAVVPRGIPAAIVLEKYFGDAALETWGGTDWVVTDGGDVLRLNLEDGETLSLDGPVASLGPLAPIHDDIDEPAARRVHAALTHDERHLWVSRWGSGEIDVVELATGSVRRVPAGDGMTLTGQLATNRAWENGGLIALHAGDHVVIYASNADDGTPIEIVRRKIEPPRDALGRSEPGSVAWSTNGLALFATTDMGVAEVIAFRVRGCGRQLVELYTVAGCAEAGVANRGRAILTANQGFVTRVDYEANCPAGVLPPTLTPTPEAGTPVPTAGPLELIYLPLASSG